MSPFEWFLLFWVGMALLQWVRIFFIVLYLFSNNERVKRDAIPMGLIFAVGGLLSFFILLVFWPTTLYKKRLDYFLLPTKEDFDIADDYINNGRGGRWKRR